ncbi:hypothetical protein PR202_ga07098 [Eleusine coracana subsp. coracana]|uniref:DUF7722 domain-containing protein n=1 Tax=Eleusine coracana subsp. coracana TaxID=191504 RepID=A0AAV5BX36_ELECO|nr:hypothetical protein PR202_ga07098 [Eleusine coracana subsp. coracana]
MHQQRPLSLLQLSWAKQCGLFIIRSRSRVASSAAAMVVIIIRSRPLHYPRYKKADYEAMPEWRLDCLLREYGLPDVAGGVDDKRRFAMGAFLWPDQY